VDTGLEAQLIGGFLESRGIPCQQESLVFQQEPVSLGLLGRVRLHVHRSDLERARRLLEEQRTGESELESDELVDRGVSDDDDRTSD
jgi:hypothetical protein